MYRLAVFTLVLLIGCQQQMPPSAEALSEAEISNIQEEIIALNAAINEGFDKADISLYEEKISIDGHRSVGNGTVYWGADEYLEMIQPYMERRKTRDAEGRESVMEIIRGEVQVLNRTTALSIDEYKTTVSEDGETRENEGVMTALWVKKDGDWKMLYGHQSNKPKNQQG